MAASRKVTPGPSAPADATLPGNDASSFLILDAPLEAFVAERAAELARSHPEVGGVVSFDGLVRNHHNGRGVTALEYSVYPELARSEGFRIVEEGRRRFDVTYVHAVHRVGPVPIGEAAVWVCAGGAHRQEAFACCRWVIDEIKKSVPIWKHEEYTDGHEEWVMGTPVPGTTEPAENALDEEYFRRQMRLPGVGVSGQLRLQNAHVAVVGLGALGCPAVTYLARAGVGRVTLIDGDTVAYHNLHRQTMYGRDDVGRFKTERVAENLHREFPRLAVEIHTTFLDNSSGRDLFSNRRPDIILDCTDRFSSRFAVHDVARESRIDLVSAAVSSTTGQLYLLPFSQSSGPCLHCLFPEQPPDGCTGSCVDDGILGAEAGIMGSFQALTALRRLLGLPGFAESTTHTIDFVHFDVHSARWQRDRGCRYCGDQSETAAAPAVNETVTVGDSPANTAQSGGGQVAPTPDVAVSSRDHLDGNRRVIDLRDREAVGGLEESLFFPGAERIPPEEFERILPNLDRAVPYVLVCEGGVRSREMKERMVELGFQRVVDIAGGFAGLRDRIR